MQFLKLRVQFSGKLRYRTQGTVWQIFSKQSNTQVDRWGDIRSVADGESGGYWTRGECGAVGDVGWEGIVGSPGDEGSVGDVRSVGEAGSREEAPIVISNDLTDFSSSFAAMAEAKQKKQQKTTFKKWRQKMQNLKHDLSQT